MPEKKTKAKEKPTSRNLSDTAHASLEDGVLSIRGRGPHHHIEIRITIEDARALRKFLNQAL